MSIPFHSPPTSARLIQVIHLQAMRGGSDPQSNPERMIELYFEPASGALIACYDPFNGPPDVFYSPTPGKKPEPSPSTATELTRDQQLDHMLSQLRQYAVEHQLTPDTVRRYFEAGMVAHRALNATDIPFIDTATIHDRQA